MSVLLPVMASAAAVVGWGRVARVIAQRTGHPASAIGAVMCWVALQVGLTVFKVGPGTAFWLIVGVAGLAAAAFPVVMSQGALSPEQDRPEYDPSDDWKYITVGLAILALALLLLA